MMWSPHGDNWLKVGCHYVEKSYLAKATSIKENVTMWFYVVMLRKLSDYHDNGMTPFHTIMRGSFNLKVLAWYKVIPLSFYKAISWHIFIASSTQFQPVWDTWALHCLDLVCVLSCTTYNLIKCYKGLKWTQIASTCWAIYLGIVLEIITNCVEILNCFIDIMCKGNVDTIFRLLSSCPS